jgi:hypothetical protein
MPAPEIHGSGRREERGVVRCAANPEGFIIEHQNLPQVLHPLKLRDLNGIARS